MPVGNLLCVVRYLFTCADGTVEPHMWCRRVPSGAEGVKLRNDIVSNGRGADDRVIITGCKFVTLFATTG